MSISSAIDVPLKNINRKKILMGLSIACVLLVNGAILGKVFFNRTEVMEKLHLSERELRLPFNYGFRKEDSSRRVLLDWSTPDTEPVSVDLNRWDWGYSKKLVLSEAHFTSFQFPDCEKSTWQHHKKSAWVLLEFKGESYTNYVARAEQYYALIQALEPTSDSALTVKEAQEKKEDAAKLLESAKNTDSRLFVIDAAANRVLLEAALKARLVTNNTKLLILPADIQASYQRCNDAKTESTEIIVNNLAVESLYVPKYFAEGFPMTEDPGAPARANVKTRFDADIYYGRLYEPWINSLHITASN